jgi:hypothetical protein
MISEIEHMMTSSSYFMELILVRNSLHYDPNESQTPKAIFDTGQDN